MWHIPLAVAADKTAETERCGACSHYIYTADAANWRRRHARDAHN